MSRAGLPFPGRGQSSLDRALALSLPVLCNFQNPDCPALPLAFQKLSISDLSSPYSLHPEQNLSSCLAQEAQGRWGAIHQQSQRHALTPGSRGISASKGGDRRQAQSRPEGSCPQPGKRGQTGRGERCFLCEEKEKAQEVSLEEAQVQMRVPASRPPPCFPPLPQLSFILDGPLLS